MAAYRELTLASVLVGVGLGAFIAATFSYAALVLGFSTGGSVIAAALGWGLLRGLLRKGSILENNMSQTIASGMTNGAAGVAFTVPAFHLLGLPVPWASAFLAVLGGSLVGSAFIAPLRVRMIALERLRFPAGVAAAAVVLAPGATREGARALLLAAVFAGLLASAQGLPALGLPALLPARLALPLGPGLAMALSPLTFGLGYLTGPRGLAVLAGGLLAHAVAAPVAAAAGWVPAGEADALARAVGIGVLSGGALAGAALAARGAGGRGARGAGGSAWAAVPWWALAAGLAGTALTAWALWAVLGALALPLALLAAAWVGLAGVVVAQATGLAFWSPVSGFALLAALAAALGTASPAAGVLVGAAVAVGLTQSADTMEDFKTGLLTGGDPRRQLAAKLGLAWLGSALGLGILALLASTQGVGPGTGLPAPQADALAGTLRALQQGVGLERYALGALVGGLLALASAPLGVLVGIGMVVPLTFILPFGLGGIAQALVARLRGAERAERRGLPVATGLVAGESLVLLALALLAALRGGSP